MKKDRENRGRPGSEYDTGQPIESRVNAAEPAIDTAQTLVHLIERSLNVGKPSLKRMCVHNSLS